MPTRTQPSRKHRRYPATVTAPIPPNQDRPNLGYPVGVSGTSYLPLPEPVPYQTQLPPRWAAWRAAATAAPGPNCPYLGNFLCPFLDVDRRIYDPFSALSGHCDRAQREVVTAKSAASRYLFCGRLRVAARSLRPAPLHQRPRVGPISVYAGKAPSHPSLPIKLCARDPIRACYWTCAVTTRCCFWFHWGRSLLAVR